MMIRPKSDTPMSYMDRAQGPFSSTLPLLNETGPKFSDATQRKLNASQQKK
jgi:hypothetical protein